MAISSSVQYNGEFLPDMILLTPCYYHRGTRLNAMKRFCICSLFKSLSRTVTCTGELSALIRVIPRGKRLNTPRLDYHTW